MVVHETLTSIAAVTALCALIAVGLGAASVAFVAVFGRIRLRDQSAERWCSAVQWVTDVDVLMLRRIRLARGIAARMWVDKWDIDRWACDGTAIQSSESTCNAHLVRVERLLLAQMRASKLVQRQLFASWLANSACAPSAAPPFAWLCAEIDAIDVALVNALVNVDSVYSLTAKLRNRVRAVVVNHHHVDPVERLALEVARNGIEI
ncbi:hypothetical protein [Curtobacterium flaccumfaciens]|uniref:hypothetical protein n=1 Tax=Curtobacterium flaccumfaciens TaxID=2035 RepID=UPI001E297E4A|nr:hypothetical protein [Curtobacterium allii]MCE0459770.1 hypothetical protein [Curtobacterium allii]